MNDPRAVPLHDGRPYLIECPPKVADVRALCLVYHGAWAAKEGELGGWGGTPSRLKP